MKISFAKFIHLEHSSTGSSTTSWKIVNGSNWLNMLVRFDLKVVLKCWDNGILVFRMNIYHRLTQRPLLDHLSARPCAHFFSSISTVFYKFDAIFRSFHSMILPNALLSTDGNFILKHFPENHAFVTSLKIASSGFQKCDNKY